MFRNQARLRSLVVAVAMLACACGDEESAGDDEVKVLDAAEKHYGKTYTQWVREWMKYVNRYHAPECANPLLDTTGEACAIDQDPALPVFFLVGTFGGVVNRSCDVPADKALFLPLANIWGDNAGVAEDMLLSQQEIRTYVESAYENIDPKRLWLRVDGEDVRGVDEGGLSAVPYTVEFVAGDNAYECSGVPGVEGEFDGYAGGYWVMLDPLPPGKHSVEFGVERGLDPVTGEPDSFELDVRYELDVQ